MKSRWMITAVRGVYLWAWQRAPLLAPFFAIIVLGLGAWQVDLKIRDDLRYAVLDVTTDLGNLLFRYESTQAFAPREILALCSEELLAAKASLRDFSTSIFFQVVHLGDELHYDSRSGRVSPWIGQPPISEKPQFGEDWWSGQPPRYVDHRISAAWLLRVGTTRSSYFWKQLAGLLRWVPLAAVVVGMLYFPHYYRDSISRRQFELLVRTVMEVPKSVKTEKELLSRLPEFVQKILGLGRVVVFRLEEANLVLVQQSPVSQPRHRPEVLRSIPIDSSEPEAVSASRQERVFIARPGGGIWRRIRSLGSSPAAGVVVPIISRIRKGPVAVLRFEQPGGIDPSDTASLDEVAQLAGILLDNIVSLQRVEETYSRMVRLTRKVAMATVVPIVAHNLRTPLTMISFIARDLAEKRVATSSEVLEKRLTQIESQTHQCLQLIEKINQYRKIGYRPGEAEDHDEYLDLIEVLNTVCDFFDAFFEIRQIHLIRSFADGFRPFIKMEDLDLLQVITNLLINSDEAFPEKDRGAINCAIRIEVEPREDGRQALIRVSDNGPGVSPAILDQLFEEHVTTKPEGTGAGLPYCRAVVETAGGTLDHEPKEEAGAAFRILLPTKAR